MTCSTSPLNYLFAPQNPEDKTAAPVEEQFELREMRDDRDTSASVAQEAERLLGDDQVDNGTSEGNAEPVNEIALGSPGRFILGLTFSAGVSGLLFGYE